ncbi:hypothetical protein [Streptomyces sp. GQFP]|uniref:hypothetical protein n=1 Tax=Streptomyces sp. GQFP TaxID=2907545 RepID=UPI001F2AC5EB|nr:hypothetical protein [Streptomyces sp. GQFP]UIX33556.1 hypothetical protein LUX31_28100 [Streptomyces sp. GQFP]
MAHTPPLSPTVHLPVRLDIGGHVIEAGTLALDPDQPTWPQCAAALRDLAAALVLAADEPPDDEQEVTADAAPRE